MTQNATLPGATFGRGSCTVKWKIAPQNKWTDASPICKEAWEAGLAVKKVIGFESTEDYRKNKASDKQHAAGDDRYEYWYPLIDWGWDREQCKSEIWEEGLPVPPKSACIFCPNMKPDELFDMSPEERGRIVRMEVVAEPYNRKVHGLWRRPRKKDNRPGSITGYMIQQGIEFEIPEDAMPLNPNCGKFKNGQTFHKDEDSDAPLLSAMLSKKDRATIDRCCRAVEDEQHAAIIETVF